MQTVDADSNWTCWQLGCALGAALDGADHARVSAFCHVSFPGAALMLTKRRHWCCRGGLGCAKQQSKRELRGTRYVALGIEPDAALFEFADEDAAAAAGKPGAAAAAGACASPMAAGQLGTAAQRGAAAAEAGAAAGLHGSASADASTLAEVRRQSFAPSSSSASGATQQACRCRRLETHTPVHHLVLYAQNVAVDSISIAQLPGHAVLIFCRCCRPWSWRDRPTSQRTAHTWQCCRYTEAAQTWATVIQPLLTDTLLNINTIITHNQSLHHPVDHQAERPSALVRREAAPAAQPAAPPRAKRLQPASALTTRLLRRRQGGLQRMQPSPRRSGRCRCVAQSCLTLCVATVVRKLVHS